MEEFVIEKVSGIGNYKGERLKEEKKRGQEDVEKIYHAPNNRVFCVKRKKAIEVRTDKNLSKLLREQYESVMVSRYYGNGGIEIVLCGQIPLDEIYDIVRLSYNLTMKMEE